MDRQVCVLLLCVRLRESHPPTTICRFLADRGPTSPWSLLLVCLHLKVTQSSLPEWTHFPKQHILWLCLNSHLHQRRRTSLCNMCSDFMAPLYTMSDPRPHFISQVWKAFCCVLGTSVSLSSGYHPQTELSDRAGEPGSGGSSLLCCSPKPILLEHLSAIRP